MKKILIAPDVFRAALKGSRTAESANVIETCRRNPDIQQWMLAHTIPMLVSEGFTGAEIKSVTHDMPQVPNNARLNEYGLQAKEDFFSAILHEAARLFKISTILTREEGVKANDIRVIKPEEFGQDLADENPERVDFMNLNLALHPIFDRVDGWYMEIIQNTAFAGGNHVSAFEEEFAAYCGAKYAVGVGSGTEALLFSLLALGIKPEDEVITVPNSFIATTEAVSQAGAKPVFVDISNKTYNIDVDLIESRISKKTKAILPVHLYGQVTHMDRIRQLADMYNLLVLEDACQAHGAIYQGKRAGTWGNAAAFSMYPGKNLGAFGEAGCVVTNDYEVYETVKCLRDHGQNKKYYHRMEGYNGRMDNLQAAALRAKLPFLDGWNNQRRMVAKQYVKELGEIEQIKLPRVTDYAAHVFHIFVVLVPDANDLAEYLKDRQITTGYHYPVPLHLQEAYRHRKELKGTFPVAEYCADHLISLPMFPELTKEQVSRVCEVIRTYYGYK